MKWGHSTNPLPTPTLLFQGRKEEKDLAKQRKKVQGGTSKSIVGEGMARHEQGQGSRKVATHSKALAQEAEESPELRPHANAMDF